MCPRVQTTTWLHELASGHHRGSQCIPEVRPWARCQNVLVLPLVLQRCWITFWKMLSNYWGWKNCNEKKQKTHKAVSLGATKGNGDRLLLDSVKAFYTLSCQEPVIWLSSSPWELIWIPGWNRSLENVPNVYRYHAFHFSGRLIWV